MTTTQHECAEKVQNVEGEEGACIIRNKCTAAGSKKGQIRMITVQGVGTGGTCGSFVKTRKVRRRVDVNKSICMKYSV